MRHIKDIALLIVTILAARLAAVALFAAALLLVDPASDSSYADLMLWPLLLLTSLAAGALLMTHLSWPFRFKVLATVPGSIAALFVMVRTIQSSETVLLIQKVGYFAVSYLDWFVGAFGIVVGALIVRYRQRAKPEPNNAFKIDVAKATRP